MLQCCGVHPYWSTKIGRLRCCHISVASNAWELFIKLVSGCSRLCRNATTSSASSLLVQHLCPTFHHRGGCLMLYMVHVLAIIGVVVCDLGLLSMHSVAPLIARSQRILDEPVRYVGVGSRLGSLVPLGLPCMSTALSKQILLGIFGIATRCLPEHTARHCSALHLKANWIPVCKWWHRLSCR